MLRVAAWSNAACCDAQAKSVEGKYRASPPSRLYTPIRDKFTKKNNSIMASQGVEWHDDPSNALYDDPSNALHDDPSNALYDDTSNALYDDLSNVRSDANFGE